MEEKKDEEDSTLNEGEAAVAIAHARRLVDSGVQPADVGIIIPYAAQVVLLKMLRGNENKLKDMEVTTVDGFQGREKEAIIISMIRSNSKKEVLLIAITKCTFQCRLRNSFDRNILRKEVICVHVGFLSDRRRMNVAVIRARDIAMSTDVTDMSTVSLSSVPIGTWPCLIHLWSNQKQKQRLL